MSPRPAWLLAVLLALAAPSVAALDGKRLDTYARETWTTRDGLPHNQVNAIAQTPDGYLWLATWEGLARYNGLEFHVFDRSNTPAIKDNGVRSVRASDDGAVVIGTSRGGVTVKRGDSWRTWMVKDGLAQEEVMDALLVKAEFWRYEQEWRAFAPDGAHTIVEFDPRIVTGIVFGANCRPEDEAWIRDAVGNRPMRYYRVIPDDKTFDLSLKQVLDR